jgi:hypothetical protein
MGFTLTRFLSFGLGFNLSQFADLVAGSADPLADDGQPRVAQISIERDKNRPERKPYALDDDPEEDGGEAWVR